MTNQTVNSLITDAITQTNVAVLGMAPAMAMGNLYQAMSNSVAMASINAVYAQQQAHMQHQAATSASVALLLSLHNTP